MVAISTGPHVWRPSWVEADKAPTFSYRIPTVTERELFEGGMAKYNALAVYPWDIGVQFRAGLGALLPDDPGEVERLDQLRASQDAGNELPPSDVAALEEAVGALMQYWPGYRLIVAQAARREAVLPVVSFSTYVTGWEGKVGPGDGPTLVRGIDGMITDAVMAQIDPLLMRALGIHIYSEMYGRGAEKNSARRSPSDGARKISRAKRTKRAGKSAPTNGEKIRDTPSPAAISPPSTSG